MSMDIFDSRARSPGDLAGVFEYDGQTGYFYLYARGGDAGERILDAIHVVSGGADFEGSDVSVRWDASEDKVGLFIRGTLWAVFDTRQRQKHGGGYGAGIAPSLPPDLAKSFNVS